MNQISAFPIGVRKSSSDCTINVGVLTFVTCRIGLSESYRAKLSQGLPKNSNSVSPCASDEPYQYSQSLIMRSACAALNRFVLVVIHAVMNPPYDPPVTPMRVESTSGRDRKSTRLNSSHGYISYAVFCLK